MNYDDPIRQIIDVLKQDKSVTQPWRNKAIARIEEAQAFIRMGKTTTNREPERETADRTETATCTCPPGGLKRSCPVHGDTA